MIHRSDYSDRLWKLNEDVSKCCFTLFVNHLFDLMTLRAISWSFPTVALRLPNTSERSKLVCYGVTVKWVRAMMYVQRDVRDASRFLSREFTSWRVVSLHSCSHVNTSSPPLVLLSSHTHTHTCPNTVNPKTESPIRLLQFIPPSDVERMFAWRALAVVKCARFEVDVRKSTSNYGKLFGVNMTTLPEE